MFYKKIILFAVFLSLISASAVGAEDSSTDVIKLKVNNSTFDVKLQNNGATKELVDRLKKSDISVDAKEYGGFEKVGDLGFSLPTCDETVTTSPGDLVLYNGNQISLFYGSNSWSYTELGKIDNATAWELENALGSGDVEIVLSLK